MKKIIGLTGSIASGKSTIAKLFQALGATIIDADHIAKTIVEPNSYCFQEIHKRYQGRFTDLTQGLDRKALRKFIFNNLDEKKWLEDITHQQILLQMQSLSEQATTNYVIWDVPLLFEVKWDKFCDRTLIVYVDPQTQIERLISRDNIDKNLALKMIDSQMSCDQKAELADDLIDNSLSLNENLDNLKQQIAKLHDFYTKM